MERNLPAVRTRRRRADSRDGAALGVVMILMLLFAVLGLGLLRNGEASAVEVVKHRQSIQSFWAAEGGIQESIVRLAVDDVYRASPTTVGGTLGGVDYAVSVQTNGASLFTLTAAATSTVWQRTITVDANVPPQIDWFDPQWAYRRSLTFGNGGRPEDLTNFPVLVTLTTGRVDYAKTFNSGDDLRFVDQNGDLLDHEIELWDETGSSYIWVRVPNVDASSDEDFMMMYYGNPSAPNAEDAPGVWANGYRSVYHLAGNPGPAGPVPDSTGNHTATNQGSTDVSAPIANGQSFSGAGQFINVGGPLAMVNSASAATLTAWVRKNTLVGRHDVMGAAISGAPSASSRASIISEGAQVGIIARSNDSDVNLVRTTTSPLSVNTWHYVVALIDYAGDQVVLYVDGVAQANNGPPSFASLTTPATDSAIGGIGAEDDGSINFHEGQLDEVRFADVARSADWVDAQYSSMRDVFITYGDEDDGTVASTMLSWDEQ